MIKPEHFLGNRNNKIIIDNLEDKKELVTNFYNTYSQKSKESNLVISNFLNELFYNNNYEISEKGGFAKQRGELDLVISDTTKEFIRAGVIIELKKPNSQEMITNDNFYKKSLYQAIYYYLLDKRENLSISKVRFLIITDSIHWFFIKTKDLDEVLTNKVDEERQIVELDISNNKTNDSYIKIENYLKNIVEKITNKTDLFGVAYNNVKLQYTYFNLKEIIKSNKLNKLELFIKTLSDNFLFDKIEVIEKTALNQDFYNELLYIIGLKENVKDNKTTLVKLNNNFSILSLTQEAILDRNPSIEEDKLDEISLELSLLWINRLLFIQLFSSVLEKYKIINEPILSSGFNSFNDINKLFFKVLSLPKDDRKSSRFENIPYINSSLFQKEKIEDFATIKDLYDGEIVEFYHDIKNKKNTIKYTSPVNSSKNSKFNILEYFITFLNSYNITVNENSTDDSEKLINASVLGKIFEKINGYKDGSFYTPSYITQYMSEKTVEKAVIDKFNKNGFLEDSIEDLRKAIYYNDKQQESHKIFNSLTFCDPAVGSGHFLVSVLNTLLLYKCKLGLLEHIKPNQLEIVEDTIIINNIEDYSKDNAHEDSILQKIYEELYKNKKEIIKNSIFGVDLNSKSVKITRLRLWIELLKHTHFTKNTKYKELELLPNIDINIKEGNSLISKYSLNHSFNEYIQNSNKLFLKYKNEISAYKEARERIEKETHIKNIEDIKSKLILKSGINSGFEWRYEFPEVLDDDGKFIGFDVIIGNPPYLSNKAIPLDDKKIYEMNYGISDDLYNYFFIKSFQLLKEDGLLNFITSNNILKIESSVII